MRKIKLVKKERVIEQNRELEQKMADLRVFADRRSEPTISYGQLMKELKRSGKLD